MDLNLYGNIWSIVESIAATITIIFTLFLFFNDPIRRWKFFGYRPTVLIVLFDPKIKKILLAKSVEWTFNQGSIYGQNITETIKETVERELGINSSLYRVYLVNPLGEVSIKGQKRLTRIALGSISIFPSLRGKGYIGCFLDCDLKKLRKKIKLGFGMEKTGVFTLKQAEEKLLSSLGNPPKVKIYKKTFKILSEILNNWHARRRSL